VEKPVLDEGAFQQLLAAAYVIQQQTDELQTGRRSASGWPATQLGSDGALGIVVETRDKLRCGTWDIDSAGQLVAEALRKITHASGVAVALERSGKLQYVSAIGTASNLSDVSLPMPPDLQGALAEGETTREAAVGAARSAGGDNDIALPLICNGKVAGIIEICFASGGPIQESDLSCCQSLAEILAEAISQGTVSAVPMVPGMPAPEQVSHRQTNSHARQRRGERKRRRRATTNEQLAVDGQNVPPLVAGANALALQTSQALSLSAMEGESQAMSPVSPPQTEVWNPWISSVRARHWLEALQSNGPARRWLDLHRSDLYLAGAILVLALSIGSLLHNSQPNVSSKTGQPTLSLFEKILVALDLAEPPANPVYTGNPNTMVWVDVRTALYYCPGAELYGKTDGGKMTTQHDAQIDQFQPAERKSCN